MLGLVTLAELHKSKRLNSFTQILNILQQYVPIYLPNYNLKKFKHLNQFEIWEQKSLKKITKLNYFALKVKI